jgi:hypothetical protein
MKPGRADLPHQGERQAPLFVEPHGGRNARALARLGREPLLRQIERGPEHPRAHAGPQGASDRHLAIGDLAQRAAVLARDAHRMRALFGKTGAIQDQHALAFGNGAPKLAPNVGGGPRRIGDEVLERLIRTGVVDSLEHRAHRLAATVAQQAEQIPTKGAALGHVAEGAFERLEPVGQAIQPRRRIPRQQHRAAAYPNRVNRTRSSNQITRDSLGKYTI